jgi:hypothetical protein
VIFLFFSLYKANKKEIKKEKERSILFTNITLFCCESFYNISLINPGMSCIDIIKNYYFCEINELIYQPPSMFTLTHEIYLFIEFIFIFCIVFHTKIRTPSSNGVLLTVIQLKAKHSRKN